LITIKYPEHIELMRKAGQICAQTLSILPSFIVPGITTKEIDLKAEEIIRDLGGVPSCKGYVHGNLPQYPGSICISVNEEAVHCVPSERIVKEGDVVKVDLVVAYKGWNADSARTVLIPPVSDDMQVLAETCYLAMWEGIKKAIDGNHVTDIGKAIESFVGSRYGIVKEFIGHGVGRNIHESPQIPNYFVKEKDALLCEGMTICIEPILTYSPDASVEINGWNTRSKTGANVVHAEHTCLITSGKPEILTLRTEELEHLPNLL